MDDGWLETQWLRDVAELTVRAAWCILVENNEEDVYQRFLTIWKRAEDAGYSFLEDAV